MQKINAYLYHTEDMEKFSKSNHTVLELFYEKQKKLKNHLTYNLGVVLFLMRDYLKL